MNGDRGKKSDRKDSRGAERSKSEKSKSDKSKSGTALR